MRVIVTGWRSGREDWIRAQQFPARDLPRLTGDQKAVAAKLGASEEGYARSSLAGEMSRSELSAKTERFGELLQSVMREKFPDASVHTIELQTFDGKLKIVAFAAGREVHLILDEELADSIMNSGSTELEARLARMVEVSLPHRNAVRAS